MPVTVSGVPLTRIKDILGLPVTIYTAATMRIAERMGAAVDVCLRMSFMRFSGTADTVTGVLEREGGTHATTDSAYRSVSVLSTI